MKNSKRKLVVFRKYTRANCCGFFMSIILHNLISHVACIARYLTWIPQGFKSRKLKVIQTQRTNVISKLPHENALLFVGLEQMKNTQFGIFTIATQRR